MKAAASIAPKEASTGNPSQWRPFGVALWWMTAAVAYFRLFVGVNFTDEAFYSSLPYSFALGLKPYHEELNITQNAGILLTPLYWLYVKLAGSPVGLILFNRHLYFALLLLGSRLARRVGTAWVDSGFGWLLAAFVLSFSYFNIPALSYNTLGALLLFLGLFQLLGERRPEPGVTKKPRTLLGANLCLVLAAFCYPPFLPACLAGFVGTLWIASRAGRACRNAWLASAMLAATGAAVFAWLATPGAIHDSLAYVASYNYTSTGQARRALIAGQFRVLWVYVAGLTVLLASAFLPGKRASGPAGLAACSVGAALLFFWHRQPLLSSLPSSSVPVLIGLGLLFPAGLCLLPDRAIAWTWMGVIGLPVGLAVPAVCFFGTNGLYSAPIAFFPAAVCTLLAGGVITRSMDRQSPSGSRRLTTTRLLFLPLLSYQCWSLLAVSFQDSPFTSPGGPVFASGAYAGLLTTPENARKWESLARDFSTLETATNTLCVYDDFPAGYLLSTLRPKTFSTWIFWPADPAIRARLMDRLFASAPPAVVLQIGRRPRWVDEAFEARGYQVYIVRPEHDYRLLLRKPATAGGAAP